MTTETASPATHRRQFLNLCCQSSLLGLGLLAGARPSAAAHSTTTLSAGEVLALLQEGNANFVAEGAMRPAIGKRRLLEVAKGQAPLAVLVGCADSRVPPEHLFGRGLGELFVVRNAGNTIDNLAQGSIEYAVAEFNVPLIVVLGHERCGAVDAALNAVQSNASFPGHIGKVVEPLIPSVLKARASLDPHSPPDRAAWLDASVRENVSRLVQQLSSSAPLLQQRVQQQKLQVVGARYDLDEGRVEFMNPAL